MIILDYITLEQAVKIEPERREISLGLPSGVPFGESRFPLTPEGTAQLTDLGLKILIEEGAGAPIHYSDAAYLRAGAKITSRTETLRADIVISAAPLSPYEAKALRRGSLLITLSGSVLENHDYAQALQQGKVNVMATDLINDGKHRLIADILHEIDGCASLAIASALLTDPVYGKGILLGGVTGIVPCEVTIIGSGMGAIAAAHNALGLGATVRMFDNDLYSLRQAGRVLNHKTVSSALHEKVLRSALREADIVVVTPTRRPFTAPLDAIDSMKERALVFDLTDRPGTAFPTLSLINLGRSTSTQIQASASRACYFNVGCRVPRTAAMALTNALTGNIEAVKEAWQSPQLMSSQMRPAMMLFWGKCVSQSLSRELQAPYFDFNILASGN